MTEDIEFYSLSKASLYAHVCRQAIFLAIKKGQLKAEKKEVNGRIQWIIKRSHLDEYRSGKYNREKRMVDGEKLFDLALDRWSVLHAAKTISSILRKPYPTAHIYYLLRTGKIIGKKKAGAWVISRDELIKLYHKEIGEEPNQMALI